MVITIKLERLAEVDAPSMSDWLDGCELGSLDGWLDGSLLG